MEARWSDRFPLLFELPVTARWFTVQVHLGLAPATLDAYGRAFTDYLQFCRQQAIAIEAATREHIALYLHQLTTRSRKSSSGQSVGFANATLQQRLVVVRLFYDALVEDGLRADHPVRRGVYTPYKGFGGYRERALIPHYQKLPWLPNDEEWRRLLTALQQESARNQLLFAFSYDAALRREEVCTLRTGDIDPSQRLLTLRAEITKGRRSRVVPYSRTTGQIYAAFLRQRQTLSHQRGPLFLSESRRNRSQPISIWTWSKAVARIAHRADVPHFTPHTLRHLCLTDLARAGWDLHEIAQFAGHRQTDTTLLYIHLSGRDLAARFAQNMNSLHEERLALLQKLTSSSEPPR